MVIGAIALLLVIVIVCWVISARNSFVRMENQYEEAFHNIDIYLKKRYDLIPNLVETVKGYAKHESGTLESVIAARSKAQSASTPAEKIEANAELTQTMRNFNMVMERYPELKANTNFLDLQNQLKNIEYELANVRKYYNATIKQFNTKIRTFPASIIAGVMKLEKQPYFELDSAEERQNVKVSF
ncbi:MAG TPA: hypothetical protein DD415_03250 [Clostridiales bacterium]|nr:hypothetical protein [Clostridiales bacterium]